MTGSEDARPILIVAGARPNFVKVAPIVAELDRRGLPVVLVHTGQHYSTILSDTMFADLELRQPDYNLEVGSGTHAQQTARVMQAFEPVFLSVRPRWLVVVGDVNSTLACSLVASKLKAEVECRIAHVEAGLRSGDWRMPEEINRVLTDRLSDLLLTPSPDALDNLLHEGIPEERVAFVGNVMIDSLLRQLPKARALNVPGQHGLTAGHYAVATLHRPSNVDSPEAFEEIVRGLTRISRVMPVVLPLHPRAQRNAEAFGLLEALAPFTLLGPLGYLDMMGLVDGAAVVLTDSGGLQEETTVLGVPCVTLREQTERPQTLTHGTNRMAPWPLHADGIAASAGDALAQGRLAVGSRCPRGWDGMAASRIAEQLSDGRR